MDTRPNDDAQLLREFAAGHSQHAFRTLVERYQDMVFSTARRRLGNEEAANDSLWQQAVEYFHGNWHSPRILGESSPVQELGGTQI